MTEIRLFAIGFGETEMKLLHGIVHLSQRRTTKLIMLPEHEIKQADVLLMDYNSPDIEKWSQYLQSIMKKTAVLWVDQPNPAPYHLSLSRPFQWSRLPLYLTKAIEKKHLHTHSKASSETEKPNKNSVNDIVDTVTLPHLLVVDDSHVVREHLYKLLTARGYHVSLASDGSDAVRMFKPEFFQVVLMDVVMPDTDGYTACRKIKKMEVGKKRTPVVMLTSKSSPFDKIRGKMAGCSTYLTKPVALDKLMKVLSAHG